jgi:hypothetical protein
VSTTDRIISIDAETNGLSGYAFAVAMTLTDGSGELDTFVRRCPISEVFPDPWVAENVLPAIADLPITCPGGYPQMLAEIGEQIAAWGGRDVPLIAHVAWPVEARLLLDVYCGKRVWDGPYPLIDVASVLLAKGFDPTTVDGYLREHGIAAPEGSPHHPLYDARAAERCFRHLMSATTRHTHVWALSGCVAEDCPDLCYCLPGGPGGHPNATCRPGYRPAAEHQARLAAEPKETL